MPPFTELLYTLCSLSPLAPSMAAIITSVFQELTDSWTSQSIILASCRTCGGFWWGEELDSSSGFPAR